MLYLISFIRHRSGDIVEILNTPSYTAILGHYGDRTAKRSGVSLMKHIDEGLVILREIGADISTMDAYCLHPLCQNDDDLRTFDPSPFSPYVIMLAMEYRRVANGYLAKHSTPPNGIELSPLISVNQMLIADKVQNRKDFLAHHLMTHPQSYRLNIYFTEWLQALGVSESRYKELVRKTQERG